MSSNQHKRPSDPYIPYMRYRMEMPVFDVRFTRRDGGLIIDMPIKAPNKSEALRIAAAIAPDCTARLCDPSEADLGT